MIKFKKKMPTKNLCPLLVTLQVTGTKDKQILKSYWITMYELAKCVVSD